MEMMMTQLSKNQRRAETSITASTRMGDAQASKTRDPRANEQTFTVRAPQAREVYVAGTFNGWDPKATPMLPAAHGEWGVAMHLAPGRYEYKFVVDGQWCCEPGCDGPHAGCPNCVPNELGSMNCVLRVRADAT